MKLQLVQSFYSLDWTLVTVFHLTSMETTKKSPLKHANCSLFSTFFCWCCKNYTKKYAQDAVFIYPYIIVWAHYSTNTQASRRQGPGLSPMAMFSALRSIFIHVRILPMTATNIIPWGKAFMYLTTCTCTKTVHAHAIVHASQFITLYIRTVQVSTSQKLIYM